MTDVRIDHKISAEGREVRREDECKHQVPEGVQQGFAQGAQGDFLTLHAIGKQHDTNGIGGFGIHPRGLLCVHGAPDGCGGGGGARGLRAAVREVFEVAAL
jgi:hypothetical protein